MIIAQAGIFASGGGPSCPASGTYAFSVGPMDYTVGATYLVNWVIPNVTLYASTAYRDYYNNGSCGTYPGSWSSITSKSGYTGYTTPTDYGDPSVIDGITYYGSSYNYEVYYDGANGFSFNQINFAYVPNGTLITTTYGVTYATIYLEASLGFVTSVTCDQEYYADGAGGYTMSQVNFQNVAYGTYYGTGTDQFARAYTEVPSGSGNNFSAGWANNEYYANGSGGWYALDANFTYYPYGTYIYNDGTYDYYWDGSGGYYT